MSKIFRCTAMGDAMYFEAESLDDTKDMLKALCGDMPDPLLTWDELDCLPDGEEFCPDIRP